MFNRIKAPKLSAVLVMLGMMACASPVLADDMSNTAAPEAPAAEAPAETPAPAAHMRHMTKEDMQKHVEARIKTLHAKLMITPDQETAWGKVADAMRDNEKDMEALIHERNESPETRTAVQDLESYQKIAQSHSDGLLKVIAAFTPLYDSMSEQQKQNADKIFGNFEGHEHAGHKKSAPVTK